MLVRLVNADLVSGNSNEDGNVGLGEDGESGAFEVGAEEGHSVRRAVDFFDVGLDPSLCTSGERFLRVMFACTRFMCFGRSGCRISSLVRGLRNSGRFLILVSCSIMCNTKSLILEASSHHPILN